ncbi:unnamed protein product [Penicillium nalgiovense]|uniref:Uncharacterized protein n=1 Tax=Penicillium nalgiovense TaxID=60175 RepID=A0A9W4IJW4_PENNA|nr:unnamed protein product [Penicillium nalgiovense]CAG7979882.1 unnamed protein product [Penicillium nalgiovense]CAG7986243.1 unnamed protein product [Penicillium nalgiovense]CAG7990996.1 unnamed protein product [Penicillium nalgiovense]CAG7991668.1 unnamed protein product [Penicillium nalgiovense]
MSLLSRHASTHFLAPLVIFPWGPLAMSYLGVPIVVGIVMVAVHDEDYQTACQKLKDLAFREIVPERTIPPEILTAIPDPDEALEEVKEEFQRLDRSTTTFEYPTNHHLAGSVKLTLAPNSFANLPVPDATGDVKQSTVSTKGYDMYRNVCHPLEEALVESFVKCVVDDKNDENAEFSGWGDRLSTWVAMMCGYLEVNNDILDSCRDERAVEWFSVNYGRIHEEKFGPLDRRVSKRLGSGHEMSVDMRGNPLPK